MVIVIRDQFTQVQILNKAVCILICTSTLGKGMNPTNMEKTEFKTSQRPGEGWGPPGYSCPKHTT